MTEPLVKLSAQLQDRVRLGLLWATVSPTSRDASAYDALLQVAAQQRVRHEGKALAQIEPVAEARRLYRSLGVDPTRTRPSSEALLRRALRGQDFYQVHPVVDVGNLVSLETLLPLGLYDRDHIQGGEVHVRVGETGECYGGIRKAPVNVGGRLTIADDAGPFGSPTSDSDRTRVRETTTRILVVFFAPADGDPARLTAACDVMARALETHVQGHCQQSGLLEGEGRPK